MCLARIGVGREGCEWMRGLGLSLTNHMGTGEVLDVCMCLGCGGVGGGVGGGLDQGLEAVCSCYVCEL